MSNLAKEHFEIQTQKGNLHVNYISTKWGKGFDCPPKSCGLCCITELPQGVPAKRFKALDNKICGHFNVMKRSCNIYGNRPLLCRTYPFIFGVENGKLIISPSLECPATNKSKTNMKVIKNIFSDPRVTQLTNDLDMFFTQAKTSKYWCEAESFWALLEDEVTAFFESDIQFPLMEKITEICCKCSDRYIGVNLPVLKIPPIYKLISDTVKVMKATSFNSSLLYHVDAKKLKARITTWNPESGTTKSIKIRLPSKPKKLEITKEATQLLRDYISLLFKRPFLSTAVLSLPFKLSPIPIHLADILNASFVHLEVGANLLSYKYVEKTITKNDMREIISLADNLLLGQFNNPRIK